jgi:hypothetical protein
MSLTVLIAEKAVPLATALAGKMRASGASVAMLDCGSRADNAAVPSPLPDGLTEIPWTRPSLLSVRTAVLETVNRFGSLDHSILFFDTARFAREYAGEDTAGMLAVFDELVRGYFLLAEESRALFAKRKAGHLCFVHIPCAADSGASPVPAAVAMAESAFCALAESTASLVASASLVRHEGADEEEAAAWLASRITEPAGRTQARWIKTGSRGLLGMF